MRTLTLTAIVIVLVATPAFSAAAKDATAHTPTYNGEVGRILLDNCAGCHRPNQIAPMSLLSYTEVRPWARAIKSQILNAAFVEFDVLIAEFVAD